MGASGWGYVTPYRGSVEATLKALHDAAFQELFGDDEKYGSLHELYADTDFIGPVPRLDRGPWRRRPRG